MEDELKPQKTFLTLPEGKQARLLETATEEFAAQGYQKASINRIVEKLGIAKGSIYQYFRNKEHLFLYVFSYGIRLAKGALKPIKSTEGTIFEKLKASLKAGIRFIQTHPRIYHIYLKILFEDKVPGRERLIKAIRFYSRDYLLPLLQEAQAKGEIRPDIDLEIAAFMLDAIMERFLQAHVLPYLDAAGIYQADMIQLDRLLDAWIDILKRGLGNEKTD
ncbi:MAG: TetR/AcrR family transcriptional regulator [Candidatus Desulfofervidaceae bacterium]|nr:TetR/AcrR family transcriptional regulator [Candidatus Desulfofervidaceae bacterium]